MVHIKLCFIAWLLMISPAYTQVESVDTNSVFETVSPEKWVLKSTPRPLFEPTSSLYFFTNKTNSNATAEFHQILSDYLAIGLNCNLHGMGDMGFFGLIPEKEVCFVFNYFLPLTTVTTDSVGDRISGHNFSLNFGKDLFYPNKTLDVIFYYGYGFSNVKLKDNSSTDKTLYKNPAFIFNFMIDQRLNLFKRKQHKFLCLGIREGYQVDISKSKWRTHHKITSDLMPFRQSGYYLQAFISFYFS